MKRSLPILLLCLACDQTTAPRQPFLQIIEGALVIDTVRSDPAQLIVVAVTNEKGAPAVGTAVHFSAGYAPYTTRRPVRFFGFADRLHDSIDVVTNEQGRASVRLRLFGTLPDTATVFITAPALGAASDSAQIIIMAGRAARLVALDDVMPIGRAKNVGIRAFDAYDNPTQVPAITFVSTTDIASVDAHGSVLAQRFGQGWIRFSSGALQDSVQIRAVPDGVIACMSFGNVQSRTLDGAIIREYGSGRTPAWSPDGNELAFSAFAEFLVIADSLGRGRYPVPQLPLVAPTPVFASGGTIYFRSNTADGFMEIWKVRRDGSGLARVQMTPSMSVGRLSVSPDARQLVFPAENDVFILDLATGATRALGIRSSIVEWGPNGQIAYWDATDRVIKLISVSGDSRRTLSGDYPYNQSVKSSGHGNAGGMGWSPDGKYLLVDTWGGPIYAYEITTGQRLEFHHRAGDPAEVSWRSR